MDASRFAMDRTRVVRFLSAFATISVLASCSSGTKAPTAAARAAPVTTAEVVERAMPVYVRVEGSVEASSTVEVRSQVPGQLLSATFHEGQDVEAGDLLFTIDARPFDAAVHEAEAALAQESAQLRNAEAQRARIEALLKEGLASKADDDAASAQAESLRAALAVDGARLDSARLQRQYASIAAPVAGRTGALLVHVGALIRANDASPLVVINQVAPVNVSFSVPARLLPDIHAQQDGGGLPVLAAIAGRKEPASTGSVTFVDNAVDPGSDMIRLKASFANEDRALWPGQLVEVTLQLSVDPRAVVVPGTAVQPSQAGFMAYVVKPDQTVEARPVTVARIEGREAVIETGLSAGEIVVTEGQLGLTPGARISVAAPVAAQSKP
jgi:multidrug efflux system membrane fusion protein